MKKTVLTMLLTVPAFAKNAIICESGATMSDAVLLLNGKINKTPLFYEQKILAKEQDKIVKEMAVLTTVKTVDQLIVTKDLPGYVVCLTAHGE